jgi:hypothetical protein
MFTPGGFFLKQPVAPRPRRAVRNHLAYPYAVISLHLQDEIFEERRWRPIK